MDVSVIIAVSERYHFRHGGVVLFCHLIENESFSVCKIGSQSSHIGLEQSLPHLGLQKT